MRGQASGITQTFRNFGSAVGMAIMGTIVLTVQQDNVEKLLEKFGLPASKAHHVAEKIQQSGAGNQASGSRAGARGSVDPTGARLKSVEHTIRRDFADAVQAAFYVGPG